jgi:hypothetical protein
MPETHFVGMAFSERGSREQPVFPNISRRQLLRNFQFHDSESSTPLRLAHGYQPTSTKGAMEMIQIQRSTDCMSTFRKDNSSLESSGRLGSFFQKCITAALLFTVLLFFSPLMAGAQELSATLSGVVTDASGAVIPHASVTITLGGVNGAVRVVETNGVGELCRHQSDCRNLFDHRDGSGL